MYLLSLWKISEFNHKDFTVNRLPLDSMISSLDQISTIIPAGVYTTFRTYDHDHALELTKHFARLDESARLVGKPLDIDFNMVRGVLRSIVQQIGGKDLRIRITLDLEREPGTIYISTESLHTPLDIVYKTGGKVFTYPLKRDNPKAKMTRQLATAACIRERFSQNKFEEILTVSEDGIILEGLSSNFFSIKGNKLWTSQEDVLCGTIRDMVLRLSVVINLQIMRTGIHISEIGTIDEAFITSTSRSILPIIQIDQTTIGMGIPGGFTQKLMETFQTELQEKLERI